MRGRMLMSSVFVLSFLVVITSTVMARECPEGKVEITVVNPAGKVITLCVPEQVTDNIGGDGDVVIPASCPCFTQEDVDDVFAVNGDSYVCTLEDGYVSGSEESCQIVKCADSNPTNPRPDYLWAVNGEPNEACCIGGEPGRLCIIAIDNRFGCQGGKDRLYEINEDEADACVAILETFVTW